MRAIFSRSPRSVEPVSSLPQPDRFDESACGPDICLGSSEQDGIDLGPLAEMKTDELFAAMDALSSQLAEGPSVLAETIENIEEIILSSHNDRESRRNAAKAKRGDLKIHTVEMRQNALGLIKERSRMTDYVITDYDATPSSLNMEDIRLLTDCFSSYLYDMDHDSEIEAYFAVDSLDGVPMPVGNNPFVRFFALEQLARLRFAQYANDYPDVAHEMLRPDTLAGERLPTGFRQLVALDLARPASHSIVTQFLKQHEADSVPLSEYIQGTNGDTGVATLLSTLALGHRLGTGIECPHNVYGLCLQKVDEIPVEDLPDEVQKGMVAAASRKHPATSAVARAVENVKPGKLWQFSAKIITERDITNNDVHPPKRRITAAANETVEATIETEPESRMIELSIDARELGYSGPVDSPEYDECLRVLIESRKFKKFFKDYDDGTLKDAILAAIKEVVTTIHYPEHPNIVPMRNIQAPKLHDQPAGKQTVMRYKGLPAGFSNPISKDVRVFFAVGGSSTAHRIHIIDIRHKTDVAKSSRNSTTI